MICICIFVLSLFKVLCHLLPNCLCKLFIKRNDIHERTRRCNLDFFLPLFLRNVCKHFVSYSGVNIWHSVNSDRKCLPFVNSFKRSLFKIISVKYLLHN